MRAEKDEGEAIRIAYIGQRVYLEGNLDNRKTFLFVIFSNEKNIFFYLPF